MATQPHCLPTSGFGLCKMAGLRCAMCGDSLVGAHQRQREVLRAVIESFVEDGDLYLKEIFDCLITNEVFAPRHREILKGSDRRQRAREVWYLFQQVPPTQFEKHVETLLKELDFLKDPVQVDLKKGLCLNCVMVTYLPLEQLADRLHSLGLMSTTFHRDIVKSKLFETDKWAKVRQFLQDHCDQDLVVSEVSRMLSDFEIPVPPQLGGILGSGLACWCVPPQQETEEAPAGDALLCGTCHHLAQHLPRQQSSRQRHGPAHNRLPAADIFPIEEAAQDDVPGLPVAESSSGQGDKQGDVQGRPAAEIFHVEHDTQEDVTLRSRSCRKTRREKMQACRAYQPNARGLS